MMIGVISKIKLRVEVYICLFLKFYQNPPYFYASQVTKNKKPLENSVFPHHFPMYQSTT